MLDEVLKLAKLRSNDPKKYLPIAVNMLKDRLKQSNSTRTRKQGVRFAHTLETIFTATDDEPELITAFLKSKNEKKTKTSVITDQDSLAPKITEVIHQETDVEPLKSTTDIRVSSYAEEISGEDSNQPIIPIVDVDEAISPTASTIVESVESNEYHPEIMSSTSVLSQTGLTLAQMIVLIAAVQKQKPLKLTSSQIRR